MDLLQRQIKFLEEAAKLCPAEILGGFPEFIERVNLLTEKHALTDDQLWIVQFNANQTVINMASSLYAEGLNTPELDAEYRELVRLGKEENIPGKLEAAQKEREARALVLQEEQVEYQKRRDFVMKFLREGPEKEPIEDDKEKTSEVPGVA